MSAGEPFQRTRLRVRAIPLPLPYQETPAHLHLHVSTSTKNHTSFKKKWRQTCTSPSLNATPGEEEEELGDEAAEVSEDASLV
eukprot:275552-Rhodomonas_salina.1